MIFAKPVLKINRAPDSPEPVHRSNWAPISLEKIQNAYIAEIAYIDESQKSRPKSQHVTDGRAAVIPLGEVNPTPAPKGAEQGHG